MADLDELPEPVRLVSGAVEAALLADFSLARTLLGSIDELALRDLCVSRREQTRGLPSASRGLQYPTVKRSTALAVHERDGWRCRYSACGYVPVIDGDVLKVLGRAGLFRYYSAPPKVWHQLAYTYLAVVDHVEPRTADPSLLTTSCWMCNAAKGDVALVDLGWCWDQEPPERPWDGLRGQLLNLKGVLKSHRLI